MQVVSLKRYPDTKPRFSGSYETEVSNTLFRYSEPRLGLSTLCRIVPYKVLALVFRTQYHD